MVEKLKKYSLTELKNMVNENLLKSEEEVPELTIKSNENIK